MSTGKKGIKLTDIGKCCVHRQKDKKNDGYWQMLCPQAKRQAKATSFSEDGGGVMVAPR